VFPLSTDYDGQRETFFLVRGRRPREQPSLSPDELRAEGLVAARWWTPGELRSVVGVRFAPSRLPELYGILLADGPPTVPVDVGV